MSRVYVGLSGGVDSAVSAALLKERGHDVVGAFIRIWQPEFIECTWKRDRLDAMRVAAHLTIPFEEIDLSAEYKRSVAEHVVSGYAKGFTPNPDILCNKEIKFGAFLRWAKGRGAEYVATGHYARTELKNGSWHLLRGADSEKDQSYFLALLGQEELSHILFPVGDLTKRDVRREARRFALPVAGKPDSQGLCFLGDIDMQEFLRRFIPLEEGPVKTLSGRTIGVHRGAALYTLGQRHGFLVKENSSVPHYVVRVDTKENIVYVSDKRSDCLRLATALTDMHWVGEAPVLPARLSGQARYREASAPCRLSEKHGELVASFHEPRLLSPGQALVFYEGDDCLGAATIAARGTITSVVESRADELREVVQSGA